VKNTVGVFLKEKNLDDPECTKKSGSPPKSGGHHHHPIILLCQPQNFSFSQILPFIDIWHLFGLISLIFALLYGFFFFSVLKFSSFSYRYFLFLLVLPQAFYLSIFLLFHIFSSI